MKRKLKKQKNIHLLDIGVAVFAGLLVIFGIWRSTTQNKPICEQPGQEHQVTLMNDEFSPKELNLKKCDVIKVINFDTQNYQLAFGVHNKHVSYPGFSEQLVGPNEFIAIDALEIGDYRIHDHLRDKAAINLIIKPNN